MMPISCIGILWERKYIHWGWSGVSGTLIGSSDRIDEADFREQIGIYILYDKEMEPVYVGQTGSSTKRLFDRLKDHTSDHLWNRWEYFSWFGLRKVNQDGSLSAYDKSERKYSVGVPDALNELEGILIRVLEPRLNKQGPRWNKNVEEFYQEIEEVVKEKTLHDIYEKQEELEGFIKELQKHNKAN